MIPAADFEALKARIAQIPSPTAPPPDMFCFDCGEEIIVRPWHDYWYMRHPRNSCAEAGRYVTAPTKEEVLEKWSPVNPF